MNANAGASEPFVPEEHPHRRKNLLTGDWVLVSPHRTKRPWLGQVEPLVEDTRPLYDPDCYLCPGNVRADGSRNPAYAATYVFDNDFAALLPDSPHGTVGTDAGGDPEASRFFRMDAERGICRVICFSPRHDLTLPEMAVEDVLAVVQVWCEQTAELAARAEIGYVQLFENKGAMMGCSNPHPHGQVWATGSVPVEPGKEDDAQRRYYATHGTPLLVDYLQAELDAEARVVLAHEHWVALTPFWALWPFETIVVPRRRVNHLPDLSEEERRDLAGLLKRLLTRYDNLFETRFPYSMGWHGRPVNRLRSEQNPGDEGPEGDMPESHWQLHAHFYPPLLRSATVKKFMVGFEMLGMPQRDITAEQAAARLRAVGDVHFRERD